MGEAPFDELAQTVTNVAAPPMPAPTRKGDSRAEVDLDWSDEEESTHVYGKGEEEPEPAQPPRGPHDLPSVIAPPAPMSAPSLREPSSQFAHRAADLRRGSSPQTLHSASHHDLVEPRPEQLRETTRGARIVPPALLTSGAAPPGPVSQRTTERRAVDIVPEARPSEELRTASVTEALPQEVSRPDLRSATPVPASHPSTRPAAPEATAARVRPEIASTQSSFRAPPAVPMMPIATPEPKRTTGILIAVVAAIAVAAVAIVFLMRRPGELVVDVRDPKGVALPKAEIFVDGRKVCDSTPCVVADLEPGARLVKASAPGYQAAPPTSAQVDGGRRSELVVTLAPATGTLLAKGDQPGVKVYVDGVDRGALPAKLEDLQPGSREVRFDGGERYKSLEKIVDVGAGGTTDLGSVRLDVLRGQITIELASDDARVTIQKDAPGNNAKVVTGPFPKTIELDGGAKWRVVASKKGLPDYVARFDFSDGVAVKTVRISMEADKPAEPVVEAAPPPPAPEPAPVREPTSSAPAPAPAPAPKDPPKEEPKEQAAGGNGKVNINSIPVSRVLVDGSPMGETPLSGVSLPAGLHTVTFIHPELGRKSVVVKVEPGKTATASAKLRD